MAPFARLRLVRLLDWLFWTLKPAQEYTSKPADVFLQLGEVAKSPARNGAEKVPMLALREDSQAGGVVEVRPGIENSNITSLIWVALLST